MTTDQTAITETTTAPSNTSTGATSQRVPITIDDLFSLRAPDEAQIAPDGKQVAFVLYEWVPARTTPRGRIWLVDTAGGEPRPFTTGANGDDEPRWSPDSQQLAFLSQREGDKQAQIYLAQLAGGDPRRVCSTPNAANSLSWSPDGSRLAFLTPEGDAPSTEPKVNEQERHQRLWTVRPESDTPEPVTPANVTIWNYAWSPDSKQIAVFYSTGPTESDWYRGQIGVVPASGGAIRQMSTLKGRQAAALTWSADGQRLYYVSGSMSDRPLVGGDIYVQPLDGSEARNLTPGIESSPSWVAELPGGQRLLYVSWAGLTNQMGLLDIASGERTTLTADFYIGDRAWPRVSTTPDQRSFVAIHSNQQHPNDLYIGEMAGADVAAGEEQVQWRRLTRLNPIAEETFAIAPNERISFEGADGWRIEGLFTPPLTNKASKDGQLPPLILEVHGGPSAAFRDTWMDRTADLSAAGYAVLSINPRGSIGRGVAFANAVLGDMGGKDFQDLMRGVDYVIERGLVDPNRMAIMGWSYGGFMAAWAVTQTTRFKAAMMGAGICDFHSFHAQSNIGNWDADFVAANWLEQPAAYRENSALTYANRVTTPTLIVHGENDPCVPVNQAYAFYRALREVGTPTELVVYPREGHGPREREHLRDLYERSLRWFERYV